MDDDFNTADALAAKLGAKGVKNIAVYDASKTDVSELIAEIFRVSHVVIACPTYNGGIYPPIENLLAHMKALAVQNRTVAVMDNGTWAATARKTVRRDEKYDGTRSETVDQIYIKSGSGR